MKLTPLPLAGAFLVDVERISDERGFFARQFCQKEFEEAGLAGTFVQWSISYNAKKGTLRGMHFQTDGAEETKLVRCVRGAIWDCILDLRPESSTYGRWYGTELSSENRRMLYIPKGFAHGFLTLQPESELLYFMDEFFSPGSSGGVRWNDPQLRIEWPAQPVVVSERDQGLPEFASLTEERKPR
ncbi:MAG: dTDP-4-dehydrorhamnose 3,5-epimerase [Candidatus Eremiobacteraeota bacterium]|nr:dTDP-4-dehydrorhamnose 3,5-epimerase [Candidatus Eremiobacteraeota bacterium]